MNRVTDVEQMKRLRGIVLELVDENHRAQQARMDDAVLWGVLQRLSYDVGRNDVITILQDLRDRGYITFDAKKNDWTGRVEIRLVQITPKGRDLVERTGIDPAVQLK